MAASLGTSLVAMEHRVLHKLMVSQLSSDLRKTYWLRLKFHGVGKVEAWSVLLWLLRAVR